MQGNNSIVRIREIEARLESLAEEQNRLVAELTKLRAARPHVDELPPLLGLTVTSKAPDSAEDGNVMGQVFCWQFCRILSTRLRNLASEFILAATP
jgi:hypothetical protein